ncbi:gamma-tubulin complex component 6 [Leptopilina heterotoma]|uniref:gamma-tubulin complex component 6 n=1 Tax=Leptopilina heterotoma TaxID=63436 RepID=UPI001CA7EEF1|nr:gamma-tubulin complex component 6 [Leptopilina heterotoma]
MALDQKNSDVFGLVTQLCEHLIEKQCLLKDQRYLTEKNSLCLLKRMRSKAFEILLNKTNYSLDSDRRYDPIAELLKHSFKLKVELGRRSQAKKLENLLDEFLLNTPEESSSFVPSIFVFLNELKNSQVEDEESLNIFNCGKANPLLPEEIGNDNEVSFQIYPLEACKLPNKFETVLGVNRESIIRDSAADPGSNLLLLNQFTSNCSVDIQSIGYQSKRGSVISTPGCVSTFSRVMSYSMGSHFLPQINEDGGFLEGIQSVEGIVTEPESPWPPHNDNQSASDIWEEQISNHSLNNEDENSKSLIIWEDIHKIPPEKNARTWENLGIEESIKEPSFLSESNEAVLHLAKLKQAAILPLLSEEALLSTPLITEISSLTFIKDIKLLLLGVESNSFCYDPVEGFSLKKNLAICGISPESLENISYEIIRWGTCFMALTNLVTPDPNSGKLQVGGLIFKAMCDSVKEFLLFYQAAVLQIPITEDEKMGLLNLLNSARPLGFLIVEVAELCQCNGLEKTSLGEGLGILTHIYEQVTKVTKPNVAFIFYSILKSCCEVYFRFLRKWIFEGICEDVYGEFMIKVKPHYVRLKDRKFWTRAFTINNQSVPGFLRSFTDSILECGKTVRLLKICDPKNAVCIVSSTCQPSVRVCLSTKMLQEQFKFCNTYRKRGEEALGSIVSLHSAFKERIEKEKRRAQLVMEAQQGTLQRLKKEKEDRLKRIEKEKCEYLQKLKSQAEEAALRKEKDKNAELLADKIFLENLTREEEEAKNLQKEEKAKTLKYYNELAVEAKKQRSRTEWRLKRMNLFDERVEFVLNLEKEMCSTIDYMNSSPTVEEEKKEVENSENIETPTEGEILSEDLKSIEENVTKLVKEEKAQEEEKEIEIEKEETDANDDKKETKKEEEEKEEVHKDENCNVNETESSISSEIKNANLTQNNESINTEECVEKKKAIRPTVLDIKSKTINDRKTDEIVSLLNPQHLTNSDYTTKELTSKITDSKVKSNYLELREITMSEAQRNKVRVMQHEFGLITPNNNEAIIDFSVEETINANFIPSLTELQINRLRNTRHQVDNSDLLQITKVPETTTDNMTEFQKNRLRNTIHRTEQGNIEKPKKTVTLTDHEEVIEEIKELGFQTPMSSATDYFTSSMNSSSIQMQSCENTPFSEIGSDIQIPTASDEIIENSKLTLESRFEHIQGKIKHPDFIGFSTDATTPTFESSLTVVDVEMLDATSLSVYLEKSVAVPLQIQCKLVNNAMIKYLLEEHNIISHLHSLRDYFFLLNGEFAKSLTHSLFTKLYDASNPFELFNSATLKNILDRAIVSSLSNTYANSELLSLSATGLPKVLQVSNPEALDCLLLNYKTSWPLNIIFDNVVMLQYTKVFKFLLMVGRVLWVLEEDFHILKTESQAATSEQYHKIHLYRHSMMQFINALHTYLTCSVLHASWAEFEKDLEHATTVDEVYSSHVVYIKKILSRCMLYKKDQRMQECLRNVFIVVLKFHNQIRSQKWILNATGYVHPNYSKLENMYKSFCKLRTYMTHVANKLANSGYQPHLTHFLLALNINSLYDIT